MALCLLLFSTLTISSPCFAITWNDDNIISFDGDLGWKIYSKSLPTYDPCRNVDNCQRFGINKYYGPFNGTDKYFLERNFECINESDVTIAYKVASCDIDTLETNEQKSHTTPYVHYIKGNQTIINGNVIIDDPTLNIAQCQTWKTQTIEQDITSVPADCKFNVLIRNKMASIKQYAYIYDIQVMCESVDEIYNGINETCSDTEVKQRSTHSEYCIKGFNDKRIDGEYRMMPDPSDPLGDGLFINDQFAFEKNDYFGNAFLFEINSNQWIISKELGSINKSDVIGECPIVFNNDTDHLAIKEDCHTLYNADHSQWINVTINEGECMDQHVVIGGSLLQAYDDKNVYNQLASWEMIIIMSTIGSFGVIIIMFHCCKWCCECMCYEYPDEKDHSHLDIKAEKVEVQVMEEISL